MCVCGGHSWHQPRQHVGAGVSSMVHAPSQTPRGCAHPEGAHLFLMPSHGPQKRLSSSTNHHSVLRVSQDWVLVTVPSLKCRFPPNSLAIPPRSPLQAALQGWALSPLSLFPFPPLTWWSYYLTAVMTIYKVDSCRTQLTMLFLSFLNVKCTLPTDSPLLVSRRP